MENIIDFTNCKRAYIDYGGSDRKFGVYYNDNIYMIKFSKKHAKRSDISTNYINNVVSEYISSHISKSAGLPTHKTVIGVYKDEIVVGCKDFREENDRNIEFAELMMAVYHSKDIGRIVMLNQIYDTLFNSINNLDDTLITSLIERYWNVFVIDALVGNMNRHMGNWGFIANNNSLRLAPVYDYGSSLFPNLSDQEAYEYIDNEFELIKRCIVFPSASLCNSREKVGKFGYYDILSSGYDINCSKAVIRMVPKIKIDKINLIIDETPLITNIRKSFYKKIIQLRKEIILDRAYKCCRTGNFDKTSYNNIIHGYSRTEKDIEDIIKKKRNKDK